MKTAFQYGIVTKRLCDAYNERVKGFSKVQKDASIVMMLETGEQSTLSGKGVIYNEYLQTGLLQGFTGCGMTPVNFCDPNAQAAPIRKMSFADTYKGVTYKATRSKFFSNIYTFIVCSIFFVLFLFKIVFV